MNKNKLIKGTILLFIMPTLIIGEMLAQPENDTISDEFEMMYIFPLRKKEKKPLGDHVVFGEDTISLYDFYDMSLSQLDSIKTLGVSNELERFINSLMSVATKKSLSTRTNPSVVTLITEEEIRNAGARDLIDVLRLVPGFQFGLDRSGKIGLGIRANWATEGKVLVMIDGQEINEHYSAHVYFGNHFPVDFIKRIEIIRGPGSAIYGGFAEYGVINIITKDGEDFDGIAAGANVKVMNNGFGGHNYWLHTAKDWENFSYNFNIFGGRSHMSDDSVYSFYNCTEDYWSCYETGIGKYVPLANNSEIDHLFFNTGISYKNFSLRHIGDLYRNTDVSTMNTDGSLYRRLGLIGHYIEAKYKFNLMPNMSLTPKMNINVQSPWERGTEYAKNLRDTSLSDSVKGSDIVRLREGLTLNWDISHRTNFLAGVDVYTDMAKIKDTSSVFYFEDSTVSYTNAAVFAQSIFILPRINILAGLRFEINSKYEPTLVPRIGITKKFDKWNFKVLASNAFRAPSIGNIYQSFDGDYVFNDDSTKIVDFEKELEPERAFVFEAELGYQLSDNTFIRANVFNILSKKTIVYHHFQDSLLRSLHGAESEISAYQNFHKSGSRGAELEIIHKSKWGYLNLNYSMYTVRNFPKISAYAVSNFHRDPEHRRILNESYLLGFARHKVNMNLCYKFSKNSSLNLTSSFFGKRYGYDVVLGGDTIDEQGNFIPAKFNVTGQIEEFKPLILTNLFYRNRNFLVKGLELGIGVNDIFNRQITYVQPYFGLNAPLPGPSREFVFKLSYQLPF